MPICPKCRTGYEDTEEFCPKCSCRKPVAVPPAEIIDKMRPRPASHYVCNKFGFFCLQMSHFVVFVSSVAAVLFGVFVLYRGEFMPGLLSLCFVAPLNYGTSIALALAIHYAEENQLVDKT